MRMNRIFERQNPNLTKSIVSPGPILDNNVQLVVCANPDVYFSRGGQNFPGGGTYYLLKNT